MAAARVVRARPAAAAGRAAAAACAAAGRPSAASGARTRSTSWRGLPPHGWPPPQWARIACAEGGRMRDMDPTVVGGTAMRGVAAAVPYARPEISKELHSTEHCDRRLNWIIREHRRGLPRRVEVEGRGGGLPWVVRARRSGEATSSARAPFRVRAASCARGPRGPCARALLCRGALSRAPPGLSALPRRRRAPARVAATRRAAAAARGARRAATTTTRGRARTRTDRTRSAHREMRPRRSARMETHLEILSFRYQI